jgi:mannose-6-phosphate isomerase
VQHSHPHYFPKKAVNELMNHRLILSPDAPFKLLKNRVWRTYTGGGFLEQWQGAAQAADSSFPEEWVASTVVAKNVGREHIREGVSRVDLGGGETADLSAIIESDPEGFLGQDHVARYGTQTALLVKVLDASERLTIQVHPDREFALEAFQSRFGKTEAWYVLGGRTIDGEEPSVLFGFKPGVTKAQWQELFERQDIEGMINALHRIPVREGDVFLVEGGIPHAIGSGCFLIEIQEPTDYTIRIERKTPAGREIPDFMCHQGAGFERMFDCFHYEACSLEEIASRYRLQPKLLERTESWEEYSLIAYEDTPYFGLKSIRIHGSYRLRQQDGFSVAVVASGEGSLIWDGGRLDVRQGEQIFLPAGLMELRCENRSADTPLHLLRCLSPMT